MNGMVYYLVSGELKRHPMKVTLIHCGGDHYKLPLTVGIEVMRNPDELARFDPRQEWDVWASSPMNIKVSTVTCVWYVGLIYIDARLLKVGKDKTEQIKKELHLNSNVSIPKRDIVNQLQLENPFKFGTVKITVP